MTVPTPSVASATSIRPLPERLEQMHRELIAQRKSTERAVWATAIIGVLLLALLAGYFFYGYTQIKLVTDPDRLVSAAQVLVEDNLPSFRQSMEKEIVRSAPAWAAELSKQAQSQFPMARTKVEELAMQQVDAKLEDVNLIAEEQFQDFLHEHHDTMAQAFKELSTSPQLSKKTLSELDAEVDQEFSGAMQEQAQEVLSNLSAINHNLKLLAANKNLNPSQELQRRTLALARRLQLEEDDPSLVGKTLTPEQTTKGKPVRVKPKGPTKTAPKKPAPAKPETEPTK